MIGESYPKQFPPLALLINVNPPTTYSLGIDKQQPISIHLSCAQPLPKVIKIMRIEVIWLIALQEI